MTQALVLPTRPEADVLSIDPGREPGYAQLNTKIIHQRPLLRIMAPEVVWVSAKPLEDFTGTDFDWVCTELQWLKGDARKRDAILTNAFIAGCQLTQAIERSKTAEASALPVADWRAALHAGNATKIVLCNRIYASLTPGEKALVDALGLGKKRRRDILDAIGIGWGAFLKGFPGCQFF